jgi:hypothetical protein
MAVSPDSVLVRGTPVLGLLHFVEKELTPEKKKIVARQVAEPWGERFATNGVIASDRVPLSAVNKLCTLAAQARGEDVVAFAERAGLFGAKEGISTVFKPFFYILSVANALSIAPLMWGRVYENGGQMRVDSRGKSAEIRITGYPGDPSGCARVSGWFRYIGELSGARNIVCRHDICTVKGSDSDLWQFNWD